MTLYVCGHLYNDYDRLCGRLVYTKPVAHANELLKLNWKRLTESDFQALVAKGVPVKYVLFATCDVEQATTCTTDMVMAEFNNVVYNRLCFYDTAILATMADKGYKACSVDYAFLYGFFKYVTITVYGKNARMYMEYVNNLYPDLWATTWNSTGNIFRCCISVRRFIKLCGKDQQYLLLPCAYNIEYHDYPVHFSIWAATMEYQSLQNLIADVEALYEMNKYPKGEKVGDAVLKLQSDNKWSSSDLVKHLDQLKDIHSVDTLEQLDACVDRVF